MSASSPAAMNRNNYATPNTPIASSKQPKKKIGTPSLASPVAKSRPEAGLAAAGRSIAEEHIPVMTRRPSQATDVMHAATPSKNLFSPNLRFGADATTTPVIAESEADKEPVTPTKPAEYQATQVMAQTPIASSKQPEVHTPVAAQAAVAPAPMAPAPQSTSPTAVNTASTAQAAAAAADDNDDDDDVFNPYLFIANLPPHVSMSQKVKVCLPPQQSSRKQMITLALDLDETLVHCSIEPIPNPDHIFPVSFNDVLYQVYVRKRPYLDHFLETIYQHFEMVVFTASQKVYADALLDLIDPEKKYVHYRLFREACVFVQGNYLKDLTVLGRDLAKTILVDNSPHTYGFHIDNGIPIESWFEDTEDTELLKLADFLKRLVDNNVTDVRPVIREHFKTYQLVNQAKLGYPVVLSAPPF